MRPELLALGALTLLSCATARPTRAFTAPHDELFTATWLALENEGHRVTGHDRIAGSLTWATGEASISGTGDDEALTLTPNDPRLLDAVERRVRATLAAWETSQEFTYDARRNLLYVSGFAVELPPEWQSLRIDAGRHHVTVQELRGRSEGNLTLVADLERRSARPTVAKTLRRAAEVLLNGVELGFLDGAPDAEDTLGLHGQLSVELPHGAVPVSWQAYQRPVGDFQVTLVMACPEERAAECETLWKRVQKSALTPAR